MLEMSSRTECQQCPLYSATLLMIPLMHCKMLLCPMPILHCWMSICAALPRLPSTSIQALGRKGRFSQRQTGHSLLRLATSRVSRRGFR